MNLSALGGFGAGIGPGIQAGQLNQAQLQEILQRIQMERAQQAQRQAATLAAQQGDASAWASLGLGAGGPTPPMPGQASVPGPSPTAPAAPAPTPYPQPGGVQQAALAPSGPTSGYNAGARTFPPWTPIPPVPPERLAPAGQGGGGAAPAAAPPAPSPMAGAPGGAMQASRSQPNFDPDAAVRRLAMDIERASPGATPQAKMAALRDRIDMATKFNPQLNAMLRQSLGEENVEVRRDMNSERERHDRQIEGLTQQLRDLTKQRLDQSGGRHADAMKTKQENAVYAYAQARVSFANMQINDILRAHAGMPPKEGNKDYPRYQQLIKQRDTAKLAAEKAKLRVAQNLGVDPDDLPDLGEAPMPGAAATPGAPDAMPPAPRGAGEVTLPAMPPAPRGAVEVTLPPLAPAAKALPKDLPDTKGVTEGTILLDDKTNQPVAKLVGGKWVAM